MTVELYLRLMENNEVIRKVIGNLIRQQVDKEVAKIQKQTDWYMRIPWTVRKIKRLQSICANSDWKTRARFYDMVHGYVPEMEIFVIRLFHYQHPREVDRKLIKGIQLMGSCLSADLIMREPENVRKVLLAVLD